MSINTLIQKPSPEIIKDLYIDVEAKTKIELFKRKSLKDDSIFYIGKHQWPGELNFKYGVSFMVFVREENCEELQIAPTSFSRKRKSSFLIKDDNISIRLIEKIDRDGNKYYVGDVTADMEMPLWRGIFFTIFLNSEDGYGEIQISPLRNPKERRHLSSLEEEKSSSPYASESRIHSYHRKPADTDRYFVRNY